MTGHNIYLHLLVAAAVTFSIRTLPLLLLRRPIRSRFLRSFLFYVPYVTLSVMVFPAMIFATDSLAAGIAVLTLGVLVAWKTENLFFTTATVCALGLILALIL